MGHQGAPIPRSTRSRPPPEERQGHTTRQPGQEEGGQQPGQAVSGGFGLGRGLSPRGDDDPRRDARRPIPSACAHAHAPGAHRREGSRRRDGPWQHPPSRGVGDRHLRRISGGPLPGRRPVDGGSPHHAVRGHGRPRLRFRAGRDRMTHAPGRGRPRRDDLEGGRVRGVLGSGGVDAEPFAVRATCSSRLRSRRNSRGRRDGSGLGRSRVFGNTGGDRGRRRRLR
jgi:hypothetical protein